MSTSRHPVAYRLEQLVGGPTKLLATVMALPLIDGIFPALVLAGALSDPLRIVETGLLIFGGSATMAVILAEMDGSPREHVASILVLAAVLLPLAALEAALAETIQSLVEMETFKRFAALVILAVAAKTASAEVGELLPRPAAIIGLGLLASISPSGAMVVFDPDPWLMARAAATAGVGVAFALGVAVAGPKLRGRVDLDRFRFGSAVALGVLGLSIVEIGIVGSDNPVALGVLLVTAVFSYDPSGESAPAGPADEDEDDSPDDGPGDGPEETGVDTDDEESDDDTSDADEETDWTTPGDVVDRGGDERGVLAELVDDLRNEAAVDGGPVAGPDPDAGTVAANGGSVTDEEPSDGVAVESTETVDESTETDESDKSPDASGDETDTEPQSGERAPWM
jgi:hypothetical protein